MRWHSDDIAFFMYTGVQRKFMFFRFALYQERTEDFLWRFS